MAHRFPPEHPSQPRHDNGAAVDRPDHKPLTAEPTVSHGRGAFLESICSEFERWEDSPVGDVVGLVSLVFIVLMLGIIARAFL